MKFLLLDCLWDAMRYAMKANYVETNRVFGDIFGEIRPTAMLLDDFKRVWIDQTTLANENVPFVNYYAYFPLFQKISDLRPRNNQR